MCFLGARRVSYTLTQNSEVFIFVKLRHSRAIPQKRLSFLEFSRSKMPQNLQKQERKSSPKRKFSAGYPADIRGSFVRITPVQNFGQGGQNR